MATYAANTEVPVEKSRTEIEATLARYGATSFAYGWDAAKAMIEFVQENRRVRFVLPLPDRSAFATQVVRVNQYEAHERARSPAQQEKAWEQACRQRWRALALAIKAKLETVEAGISTFEAEFAAMIVLPNGQTVGDWLLPQLETAYANGAMPAPLALPAGSGS